MGNKEMNNSDEEPISFPVAAELCISMLSAIVSKSGMNRSLFYAPTTTG